MSLNRSSAADEEVLVSLLVADCDPRVHDLGLLAGPVGVLGDGRHLCSLVSPPRHGDGYPKLILALKDGSQQMLPVAATCAAAGIIVGVVAKTGLGLKFSAIVIAYAGGSLLMTALYTSLIVWIIGLAVPVTASYIICAVIAAPALIKLGVPDYAAHMFIFYYAVLSEVSPPTALSPFAAAAITGGDPYKTTLQSWKYTLPAFVVPFIFVLDPAGIALLLKLPPDGSCAARGVDLADGVPRHCGARRRNAEVDARRVHATRAYCSDRERSLAHLSRTSRGLRRPGRRDGRSNRAVVASPASGAGMSEEPRARGDMRKLDILLEQYGETHQNPTNKAIHWVCVPLIMWSALAALWVASPIAVYALIAFSVVYYALMSLPLAIGMLVLAALDDRAAAATGSEPHLDRALDFRSCMDRTIRRPRDRRT